MGKVLRVKVVVGMKRHDRSGFYGGKESLDYYPWETAKGRRLRGIARLLLAAAREIAASSKQGQ